MDSQLRSEVLFHLTGRPVGPDTTSALPAGMRPALMAPYRRLDALRHDFPLLLTERPEACVTGLTTAVDAALRAVAQPGTAGEGVRRRALRVERAIRRRVLDGATGSLRDLWDAVVDQLAGAGAEGSLRKETAAVREALPLEGQLVGCDARVASTVVQHAWRVVQRDKCRVARARIAGLVQRLEAIVRADEARSAEAYTPARLGATIGAPHRNLFDFGAMARLLGQPRPRGGLPEARRRRIADVLELLRSQWLFPADGEAGFACAKTGEALDEFLRRLPAMVALHKALQVGELEASGRYVEELHDPVFAALDERSLSAEDLGFFPDLLVCTTAAAVHGSNAALIEALATGAPLKLLVELDDVLERPAAFGTATRFGVRESQLAASAMSLGEAFVLQTVASNLLQARDAVQRGLRYPGAALFAVYAGPPAGAAGDVPTYLVTAAALQSRAFPTFSYDPRAGADLATRFSLAGNPQVETDWPVETVSYADADLQSATEAVAFTFLDFALCDPRLAEHYAVVPRAHWGTGLVPAAGWLADPPADVTAQLPYVLAVDDADLLCRLVVDDRLVRAALRCRDAWRRLQELGGVRDSRVERILARERELWQARLERELASRPAVEAAAAPPAPVPASAAAAAAAVEAVQDPPRNPDEPSVETLRCSSCNECTLAYPKIFAYNDEKQAYIKDARAGTYRQLVEAAEACQVSVIHPGKPWDPTEPGLEELLERAQPFL